MDKKTSQRKNRLSFKTAFFKCAYVHNPVLTTLTGSCAIVAAATNLKTASMLSFAFAIVLVVCEVFASLALKRFSRWVRICFYTLISGFLLACLGFVADPAVSAALGVYLPFICVNGIIVLRCEKFAVRTSVYNAFVDSVAASVGFAAVTLIVGAARYLISLLFFEAESSAVSLPFISLIILGFIAAIHKWSVITFFPDEIVDSFSLSGAFEKPELKDPGLKSGKQRREQREKKKLQNKEIDDYEQIKPRYTIEEIDFSDSKNEEDE